MSEPSKGNPYAKYWDDLSSLTDILKDICRDTGVASMLKEEIAERISELRGESRGEADGNGSKARVDARHDCPHCRHAFGIPTGTSGVWVTCPKCGKGFLKPSSATPQPMVRTPAPAQPTPSAPELGPRPSRPPRQDHRPRHIPKTAVMREWLYREDRAMGALGLLFLVLCGGVVWMLTPDKMEIMKQVGWVLVCGVPLVALAVMFLTRPGVLSGLKDISLGLLALLALIAMGGLLLGGVFSLVGWLGTTTQKSSMFPSLSVVQGLGVAVAALVFVMSRNKK